MREIKFRAWDKKHKYMTACVSLKDLQEGFTGIYGDDNEVMQYTGLKDKNGKEIYEGDIVKDSYEKGKVELITADIPNCCCSSWDVTGWFYKGDRPLDQYVEVIGNVYENKELL